MQSYDIPLHDIKPIVEVDEYSFYYFIASIGLAAFLSFVLFYLAYYFYKKTKRISTRKVHKEILESLNVQDTKNTAYAISTYGILFKDDSPQHAQMYENLIKNLNDYKYKKDVDTFDKETLEYITMYKEMLNA